MRGGRFVFIADDLTGANDSGVQIAKRGIETVTLLDPALAASEGAAAIVIDTESRSLPVELARAAAGAAAREAAAARRGALLYKKIDSTLRGHIGAELEALVRELAPDVVLCAPAFPKVGRTTRGGVHFVRGIPLDRTEFASDPRNPVDTAVLPELLAREGGPLFTHVGLDELRGGWSVARSAKRLQSFDCESDEDLRRIAEGGLASGARILWCGSAGLAEALLEAAFPLEHVGAGARLPESVRPRAGSVPPAGHAAGEAGTRPVLSVVGSMSEVSRRQLRRALGERGTRAVRVDLPSLRSEAAGECLRLVSSLESDPAGHLILTAFGPDAAPPAGVEPALPDAFDLPAAITRCLACAAARFLDRFRVAGLFLTGGETAFWVVRAAGAGGMRIVRELEPGVPAVRFLGGALDGLPGVTKAGAFGGEEAILRAAEYLAGVRR